MISTKGLALTIGIFWAAAVFLVALGNFAWPPYGAAFLDVVRSIYPGFASTTGFWGIIVGTLYALIDGLIAGWLFAWLYNRLTRQGETTA